jgi:riboflavin synthase
MFSGIVEEMGTVGKVEPREGLTRLTIAAAKTLEGLKIGDSIAINGTCLTIVARGARDFTVELAPETLRRTNLGDRALDDAVNLERSLAVGDRIGGHFVQGHVDGTGRVASLTPEGEARIIEFEAPPHILRYAVPKGFIAVDGVSLTVVERRATSFTVSFIPYTLAHTIAGKYRVGAPVNLEADVLGKYVEALLAERAAR